MKLAKDDQQDFESTRLRDAQRMCEDRDLADKVLDLAVHADQYNYTYQWSWLGLPIIQVPPDIIALQEIVWISRPTLIIETGIARGGSLVFFASLLQLLGEGCVIGVDIDIRQHNRRALENHFLYHRIQLIEGSSTAPDTISSISSLIRPHDRVMVILDSDHTHEHVREELSIYAPWITKGCYLVVADTIIEDMPQQEHRSRQWRPGNNPKTAVNEFLRDDSRFVVDSEIENKLLITSSPGGYLKCIG